MRISEEISHGVSVELTLVNDRLQIRLISANGHQTAFQLSEQATEQLRASLIDYDQLRQHYQQLSATPTLRKRQRAALNPLYWQLACLHFQDKAQRQIAFAQMQASGMTAKEVEEQIKKFAHSDLT